MGQPPRQIRAALHVIERAAGARDPAMLVDAALEAVRLGADADVAVHYRLGSVRGARTATSYRHLAPPRVASAVDTIFRGGFVPILDYRDPLTRRRRFLHYTQLGATPEQLARGRQLIFAPMGVVDQLRMTVFDGRRFVGHIGAYRRLGEPAFLPRESALVQSLVPAVAGILTAAATRECTAGSVDDWCVLLVRPDGHVEHASAAAARWLSSRPFREALRWVIRSWPAELSTHRIVLLDRVAATVVRLNGPNSTRFLVEPTRAAPFVLDAGVVLSPTQKRVADLAACGLVLDEIAAELGAARETVKSHLRECYRRLGVSTRLELARAMQER